jgi:hypothetical protein
VVGSQQLARRAWPSLVLFNSTVAALDRANTTAAARVLAEARIVDVAAAVVDWLSVCTPDVEEPPEDSEALEGLEAAAVQEAAVLALRRMLPYASAAVQEAAAAATADAMLACVAEEVCARDHSDCGVGSGRHLSLLRARVTR